MGNLYRSIVSSGWGCRYGTHTFTLVIYPIYFNIRNTPSLCRPDRKMKSNRNMDHGDILDWDEDIISINMLDTHQSMPNDENMAKTWPVIECALEFKGIIIISITIIDITNTNVMHMGICCFLPSCFPLCVIQFSLISKIVVFKYLHSLPIG